MVTLDEAKELLGVTEEGLAAARKRTDDYIEAYNLKQAREAAHLTQASVASSMGVSQARISELESGQIDSIRLGTLRRYVASIGGTLDISVKLPNGEAHFTS